MDENIVGFPEGADNTQFVVFSDADIASLKQTLREFVEYEIAEMMTADEFVFAIENEHFDGLIKLLLSNDHVTIEDPERFPELFTISGEAVLLDMDGEEVDVLLRVNGGLDFSMHQTGGPLGTLTVWRREVERYDLPDAS